uniref:Uncharacterized protein n=1 Tax=Equus caballus TaxID=9796 RepID=A0A9L0S6K0_HORSE
MNIGVHMLLWIVDFKLFGWIPSSGMAGLYGSSIFSFLRNLHTVYCSGCTSLHFYQQCMRIPFSPHSLQHLLFLVSAIIAILTGGMWYLSVFLICISLMVNDVEHLFMCLLAICISSLENVHILCPLLISLFAFLLFSCVSSLYIMQINPLPDI